MTDDADSGKLPDDASSGGTSQDDLNADDGTQQVDSSEPDRFKGKSREEILKMYQEAESHFNKKLDEVKDMTSKEVQALRNDLQAEQSWRMQNQQPQNPQNTQQAPPVDNAKIVDALLEDPVNTLNRILDYRDQQKSYKEAWSEGPVAFAKAKKERPDIFEGVDENRLQQLMYGGIQSGTILPQFAKNPEAWKFLAGNTKLAQNDYKFQVPPPTPPTPPQGDLPPATKPQVGDTDEHEVDFDPLTDELRRAFGKTKEQAAKMITDWRKNPDPRMSMVDTE